MIPLLPMPVTTTRPMQEWRHSTAVEKSPDIGPAMRFAKARRASASMRTTLEPMECTVIISTKKYGSAHAILLQIYFTSKNAKGAKEGQNPKSKPKIKTKNQNQRSKPKIKTKDQNQRSKPKSTSHRRGRRRRREEAQSKPRDAGRPAINKSISRSIEFSV